MQADRSNVIPFRQPNPACHSADPLQPRPCHIRVLKGLWWLCHKSLCLILGACFSVIFLMLWWLRRPVRVVFEFLAGASLLALSLVWIGLPEEASSKTSMLLCLAVIGLGSTALLWLYDALLLRVAPDLILTVES